MTSTVTEVSQTQSLAAVRNFIRVAVSCVTYLRGLCSDESYQPRQFLGLQLKQLIRSSPESDAISQWMEEGAFDALNKGYLKELSLCLYTPNYTELLESYSFIISYSADSQRAALSMTSNSQKEGRNCGVVAPPIDDGTGRSKRRRRSRQDVQHALVTIIKKLMEVVEGLPPLVCEHVLSMQLMYYDNITPLTYEPPFFAPASKHILDINPQGQKSSIDIATLDTGHHVLSVTIKHPFFEQLRSHLSASTTGCERARSLTDVCSSREKEESAAVRSEKEGKEGLPATVFHVGPNGGTLRSVEVAFLVFASFVVTKSPVVGRGRVTTREIEEYLRVSCPLEIQMEDVKHMMHQLEERGVVTPETSFEWSVSAPKSSEIAKVVIAEPDVVPLLSAQTRVELQRLTGGPGKARVSAAKSSRKRVRA